MEGQRQPRPGTADYVRKVFAQAAAYAADTTLELPAGDLLARVISFAYTKIGTPYQWGGDGSNGYYDCSGFTMRAYQQAGVQLPRTSRQQYLASPHVAQDSLQPGDLLYWAHDLSDPGTIHHVAIYLGRDAQGVDWMIDAPTPAPPSRSAASTGPVTSARPVRWSANTSRVGPTDRCQIQPCSQARWAAACRELTPSLAMAADR